MERTGGASVRRRARHPAGAPTAASGWLAEAEAVVIVVLPHEEQAELLAAVLLHLDRAGFGTPDARLLMALIEQQYTNDQRVIRREDHFDESGQARIGLTIAEEERGQERMNEGGGPVLDEVFRNETVALIRSQLPPAVAENVLAKLDSGEWTDDQARGVIAEYRER